MLKRLAMSMLLGVSVAFFCSAADCWAGGVKIALTFDDLPVAGTLPDGYDRETVANSIIATLRAHHVSGVYGFVNGAHVENFPNLISVLKSWRGAGFLLGNHGYSHLDFDNTTLPDYIENLNINEPLLKDLMGREDWHYWRFPYLRAGKPQSVHDQFADYLQSKHYVTAPVSISFDDWYYNDYFIACGKSGNQAGTQALQASYLQRAAVWLSNSRQLSDQIYHRQIPLILLLHPNYFESKALPQLLDQLEKQGAEFVSLPDAVADKAYRSRSADSGEGIFLLEEARLQLLNLPVPVPPLASIASICKDSVVTR
jgi:peptidoglycan/xylan/chitin deacetylase (PgdA/CDA1 family)